MGETTAIAWTDRTWNPWQGCHRVSPGCMHCYMHREKLRYGQDPGTVVLSKPPTFNAPLSKKWAAPARVFTCSWSDFFITEADAWRPQAWEIIRRTPHLTYQILTKRPENIASRLPTGWPLSNVWMGISVEGQDELSRRMPDFVAATVGVRRFVSAEPLLGPLRIGPWFNAIDWLIIGGESGPRARSMNLAWASALVAECHAATIPVFVKQLGGHPNKRDRLEDFPADLQIREFPR